MVNTGEIRCWNAAKYVRLYGVTRMFKALKIAMIAGCCLIGFAQNGFAADMDQPIFVEEAPELQPVEIGNGWYIRGDIGANFAGKHETTEYAPGGTLDVRYINDFSDAVNVGVGAGYQVNDYFRVDAGAERLFSSDFSSTQLLPDSAALGLATSRRGPCRGWREILDPVTGTRVRVPAEIINCLDVDSASYSASNFMANAYIDLGTYVGFTPYVGAGVGVARVEWQEDTDATQCIPVAPEVYAEGCSAVGTVNQPKPNEAYTEKGVTNDGVDYRLSYAVTAGVGYKVSKNLTWDLSYRMLNVGGNDVTYSTAPGSGMAKDGFGTQQVRLGFRYSLW
jgi:opacity protein-like surface antigen